MNLQELSLRLIENDKEGYAFDCQPIPGEVEVLQVIVDQMDELPIYISVTDTQILCIAYLCTEDDIDKGKYADMCVGMLEMNIPMPLSSFAKVDNRFVVFGALSLNSSFDDIVHEIITLNENAMEAMNSLEEYFK